MTLASTLCAQVDEVGDGDADEGDHDAPMPRRAGTAPAAETVRWASLPADHRLEPVLEEVEVVPERQVEHSRRRPRARARTTSGRVIVQGDSWG